MKYTVTMKNGVLGITCENQLEKYVEGFEKKLKHFADDLTHLTLLIKRHERQHFYSAVVTLSLPHKPIVANVGSYSLEELLKEAFDKLENSFETYKGKHFKGSSKYPRHESIRKKVQM